MQGLRIWRIFLVVVGGVALVAMSLVVLTVSPALAQGSEPAVKVPLAQPPPPDDDDLQFIAFFTDELSIPITDQSGNVIGEGKHLGQVRCNRNNCSHKTNLELLNTEYEYKFSTRQALDPEAERAVVAGTGTISGRGQKARFSFTATFEDLNKLIKSRR